MLSALLKQAYLLLPKYYTWLMSSQVNIHTTYGSRKWDSSQGNQYRTEGCTGLASGTIYFGYWLIPVYRFGFIAIILYIYIYIYIYILDYLFRIIYKSI